MAISVVLQNLGPPSNTATPTFSALVKDPSLQVKARFTVYQSDGTSKIGTVDSNYIVGSGIVSATFNTTLPIGTYKVSAKAINTNGEESAESAQITFYVAYSVAKTSTYIWNVDSFFTVVTDNLDLKWIVDEDNVKSLKLVWNSDALITKTLSLKWAVNPIWQKVPEPAVSWVGVTE